MEKNFNEEAVTLTAEQNEALAIMEDGWNVFLSGEAGTGKSYVLNEFIKRNSHKQMLVCAPTGVAALNVKGVTLHRTFGIPTRPLGRGEYNWFPNAAVEKAEIIIIDEISMCRRDVFEYVVRTIQHAEVQTNKPKQIIIVGDFYQLPPVITPHDKDYLRETWDIHSADESFAFTADTWRSLGLKCIVLKQIMRQKDDEINTMFKENLNKIRSGNVDALTWFNRNTSYDFNEDSIFLCCTNKKAEDYNRMRLHALRTPERYYDAIKEGEVKISDEATDEHLLIKEGMRVMTLVNDSCYQNGSLGTVIALDEQSVTVKLDNGNVATIFPFRWDICNYTVVGDEVVKDCIGHYTQLPLKCAYAITVHKSQGQTYASANIDPECFTVGQLYVALSRVSDFTGLRLSCYIRNNALKTSSNVQAFYNSIQEVTLEGLKKEYGENVFGNEYSAAPLNVAEECVAEDNISSIWSEPFPMGPVADPRPNIPVPPQIMRPNKYY